MNFERMSIECTVKKVYRRQAALGPVLYDVYIYIPSIVSQRRNVEDSLLISHIACVPERYQFPTTNGYKIVTDLKFGDTLLLSLDTMHD